jgi:hypothetical protein
MARQIGTALGISILVALLGTPAPRVSLAIFQHGWAFMVIVAVLDGIAVRALRRSLPPVARGLRHHDSSFGERCENATAIPIPIPVEVRR